MSCELSYILFTPYTIARSRTGGVLSRLLVRLDDLELVGARMIAPTAELAEAYARSQTDHMGADDPVAKMKRDYILRTFSPSAGRRHRVLVLLFRGKDAASKLRAVAGSVFPEKRDLANSKGETIRDTYGDLVFDPNDPSRVEYFEPVVFTPVNDEQCLDDLRLFRDFFAGEPNIVENMAYDNPEKIERTLVIIKPDNWVVPSSRPGTIIDMFSRTGLRIIGTKILQMSVAQGLEFYGPVEDVLINKLGPKFGADAADTLEDKFKFTLSEEARGEIVRAFGTAYGKDQFNQIVGFMTGVRPDECPIEDRDNLGKSKCMVLIYEGEDAVKKIRDVLGPTDPTKAPAGTVRREFGSNVMVNTAHASDSPDNAKREMGIVKIEQNRSGEIIDAFLKTLEK